jgi:DNA-binding transcriptional MerR regulator
MPLSRSRDYLSIGEVLDAVRGDFPDVSISKIRFLEAEGLIEPERTPSGYRKFFDKDVERLRYILSMQRDQFLPLKVIKERLAGGMANGGAPQTPTPVPSSAPAMPAPQAAGMAPPSPVRSVPTEVSLSLDELRAASGLDERQFQGLVDFGILEGSKETFDGDDLVAAKAAGGLFRYGVEPRHLKMYRHFAERESAFFEQIVSPVTRRRDPDAQREAASSLQDLVGLAQQFRDALQRSSMRDLL